MWWPACRIQVAPSPQCRKVWLMLPTRVPCSNVANTRGCKTWMESEFCTLQNSTKGQEPPKMYIQRTSRRDGQTLCKLWLTSIEWRRCSNETNTRNLLKFAGVPQTGKRISAANGQKFTILWECVEDILLFNSGFFWLPIHALVEKTQPVKVVWWCADGEFLAIFCILYFQWAACSTFQTCILNSH